MKTFFDSSALVSLLSPASPYRGAAVALWKSSSERLTSCHALLETYRTLTSLAKPMPPAAACQQLERLATQLRVCASQPDHYLEVLRTVAGRSFSGPIVYDALHAECARRNGASLWPTKCFVQSSIWISHLSGSSPGTIPADYFRPALPRWHEARSSSVPSRIQKEGRSLRLTSQEGFPSGRSSTPADFLS